MTQLAAQILIVDDDPNNRLLLATILEHAGYAVFEAEDGAEALRAAKERPPDLVIVDLHMPGMNGIDFLKALRADGALAHVRVALYTATTANLDLRQFMESIGVKYMIQKPSEPQAVLDVVSAILSS